MITIKATLPEFLTPTLTSTSRYSSSDGVSVSQIGRRRFTSPITFCIRETSSWSKVSAVSEINKLVAEFDPAIPLERASTPPSSWYTDPQFYSFELDRVFYGGWQAVGYSDQIKENRDFFTGRLGDVEFVVCRDDNGKIHAFHNVCSHHASILASGNGKKPCFVCPYHGWTYSLSGSLIKATGMTGIDNFALNVWRVVVDTILDRHELVDGSENEEEFEAEINTKDPKEDNEVITPTGLITRSRTSKPAGILQQSVRRIEEQFKDLSLRNVTTTFQTIQAQESPC